MVFAHVFPISNENEIEQLTVGCIGFAWIFFGPKRNRFWSHFPRFENENEYEQLTLECAGFVRFCLLSETVFAHIFHVSNENENEQLTMLSSKVKICFIVYGIVQFRKAKSKYIYFHRFF